MTSATPYDDVPYPTGAYAQTHPGRLATIATLFGMSPAPLDRCRVLEIGCGDGGNLIPMAFVLPGSSFTGIDLAARPVAAGQAFIGRAGLKNVALHCQDLRTLAPGQAGTFDYIIAHGVYAWVAPAVQERLIAAFGALLAPQGVAFVSYNAFPGSHLRQMVREMAQFHVRDVPEPGPRLEQAKSFLAFLRRVWPEPTDVRHWVGRQAEIALGRERDTLFHDELSEEYHPAYFHQVAEQAGRHGLQYLGEADFHEMNDGAFPREAVELLRTFGPERLVEKEQHMDFLKCRSFRQTLLCRQELPLRRGVAPGIVESFRIETRAFPVEAGTDPESRDPVEYRTPKGATMSTQDPMIKRMMARLARAWPGSVAFRDLVSDPASALELPRFILQMYGSGIVELHLEAPSFVVEPGERPEASRLVRLQLERRNTVTNLLHLDMNLEDSRLRTLVGLLDGTRDRAALLRDLAGDGARVSPAVLEDALRQLARLGLLSA